LRRWADFSFIRSPDDELARYRHAIEAVTIADVQKVAQDHIRPGELAIVAVGDADAVGADLRAAGFGDLEVITDDAPAVEGEGEEETE
jgi:zinc protease